MTGTWTVEPGFFGSVLTVTAWPWPARWEEVRP